jgi:hypothetical protein
MKLASVAFAAIVTITSSQSQAQSAVERQCSTGKCTCSYIASTCRSWNSKHGGDQVVCESYRQACLSSGSWQDRNRSIANVIRR